MARIEKPGSCGQSKRIPSTYAKGAWTKIEAVEAGQKAMYKDLQL